MKRHETINTYDWITEKLLKLNDKPNKINAQKDKNNAR